MDPQLSVIIPAYNAEPWIACLLESLLKQCDQRCEIIVVDDCSNDHTRDILADWCSDRLRLIELATNQGPAVARNAGAAAARGRHLLFFDSDDIPSPALLPCVLEILRRYPELEFASYLCAEQSLAHIDRAVLANRDSPLEVQSWARHAYASQLLSGRRLVTASSVFLSKRLFDAHGGFCAGMRVYEDPELWCRISAVKPLIQVLAVLAIYRIPQKLGNARARPDSAEQFVRSLRVLSRTHGPLYNRLADRISLKAAVLSRMAGTPALACLHHLRITDASRLTRLACCALVLGVPYLLRPAARLYRWVQHRRHAFDTVQASSATGRRTQS